MWYHVYSRKRLYRHVTFFLLCREQPWGQTWGQLPHQYTSVCPVPSGLPLREPSSVSGSSCSSAHSSVSLFMCSLAVSCGSGTHATEIPAALLKWWKWFICQKCRWISVVAGIQDVRIENVEGWCKPKNRNGQSTSSGARGFDEIGSTIMKKELVQALEYRGNTKSFKLGYCFSFLFFFFF